MGVEEQREPKHVTAANKTVDFAVVAVAVALLKLWLTHLLNSEMQSENATSAR